MLSQMKTALILMFMMSSLAVQAAAYKWTDERGNVIYSDTPREGAVEIKDLEVQTYDAPALPKSAPKPASKPDPVKYKSLKLMSPAPEQVIWADTAGVPVSASLDPPLNGRLGHRIRFVFNGSVYGEPGNALNITLQEVFRGTHTIKAEVIDKSGKVLIGSQPVSFHLKQHSIKN